MNQKLQSEVLSFGRHQEMLGILTKPALDTRFPKRILLTWNTGISHRIGPHRLNVELAEVLSRLGLAVFRFDLTGRGDSAPRQGEPARAVMDVREAMDFLQATCGYQEFILHGLCSGAIEAHYAAHADPRVIGLSMIDTYAYRVGAYYLHYFRKRILNARAWQRLFLRACGRLPREEAGDQFFVPFPSFERLQADYRDFKARQLKCMIVYSGGYDFVYNYQNQFFDMFKTIDLQQLINIVHQPEADHLFTLLEHRQRLLDSIAHWVLREFAIIPPPAD